MRGKVFVVFVAAVAGVLTFGGPAVANHWPEFRHDHSSRGTPPRPNGLSELNRIFGPACNAAADDARVWWPTEDARGVGGYEYYHPYLAINIGHNLRGHSNSSHKDGSIDYLVEGYLCRPIAGSTAMSTHSWGAAIDTNTARNPQGQNYWNGVGADGRDYGRYIPDLFRGSDPAHHFRWGFTFPTPDPHHFQYVINY